MDCWEASCHAFGQREAGTSANSDDAKFLASFVAAIVVFFAAVLCMPFLIYVSLGMFGFPANVVVLGAYLGWLFLRRHSRMVADMCGVAFAVAIAVNLTFFLLIKPSAALTILPPAGLLCLGVEGFSRRFARRPAAS